jgi:hypothetical protein
MRVHACMHVYMCVPLCKEVGQKNSLDGTCGLTLNRIESNIELS